MPISSRKAALREQLDGSTTEHVVSLPAALQKFWIVPGVPCSWCVFYGPTGADWLTEVKAEKL